MVEKNAHDQLPTASPESQQPQHRPTTSAASSLSLGNGSHGIAASRPVYHRQHGASKSMSYSVDRDFGSSANSIRRGKDWESFYTPHTNRVQSTSPKFGKPLRKTGLFPDLQRQQPKSASAIGYAASQNSTEQPAALSEIKTVYMVSPRYAQQHLGHLSSISVGSQPVLAGSRPVSAGSQPVSAGSQPASVSSQPVSVGSRPGDSATVEPAAHIRPPSPDHNILPKYVSAFAYAIQPFLYTLVDDPTEEELCLPPPPHRDEIAGPSSPIILPLQECGSTGYDSEEEEEQEEVPEYGIPNHLMETDGFRTRMRHIQLRTYLMQCNILHNTVCHIQRTPWNSKKQHSPTWYYEKIRSLAYKARPLAEALESRDLQARCEYWAGRGCGGTRDYEAAAAHFQRALLFDEPNDTFPSGKSRLRGLLPTEKADVRFLLDSCTARQRSWEQRIKVAKEHARIQSEATGLPISAFIDKNMPPSPVWMPDRDRIVQLARFTCDAQDPGLQNTVDFHLEQQLEDLSQVRWKHEDENIQSMKRRTFTKEEWHYIQHGTNTPQHAIPLVPEPQTPTNNIQTHTWKMNPRIKTPTLSPCSTLSPSQSQSLSPPPSSPSYSYPPSRNESTHPSPALSIPRRNVQPLKNRRNISLHDIITDTREPDTFDTTQYTARLFQGGV